MTCWVVIPAKAAPAAKGRLAEALGPDERAALAAAMLSAAIAAVRAAPGVDGVLLVGDAAGHSETERLTDPGGGLNAALDAARTVLLARGATRVISLAADLPLVTGDDVAALVQLPNGTAGIAPDRHGTGTNALSLPLPQAAGFAYAYGIGSCARHKAETARLGLNLREIVLPGLARDVDEPADLVDAGHLMSQFAPPRLS